MATTITARAIPRYTHRDDELDEVVTVNATVAVCWPTSVTVTVVPDVPLGTVNVQLNDPVPSVVREPLVQLVIGTESNTRADNGVETENPIPDTVTVEPTDPWVGVTVIVGVVTVKLPVAVCPPTSVATTVVDDVPLGTANVQLNAPVAPVVREPLVQVEIVTPSRTNPTGVVTEKPVPETVTVAPVGPWPGVTAIAVVVTVNVPVAVCPPASVATTDVPEDAVGTWNVHVNEPVTFVVREPLLQLVTVTESNTNDDNSADAENPVPDTVTVAPTGPCVGLTVIAGEVTVNVPTAV
jgi:hypothetical protein